MKLELAPGEKIVVALTDTDGEFTIEYGDTDLTVHADLADATGRKGVIYHEPFGDLPESRDQDGEREITAPPPSGFNDGFSGDTASLISNMRALVELDERNALAPHGIGGHARTLLKAAASRLEQTLSTEGATK